jgi:hypothetical protein
MSSIAWTAVDKILNGEQTIRLGQELTLSENTDRLTEIARLAICPLCILQHTVDKSKLTKEAVLMRAACGDVGLCHYPNWVAIV